MREVLADRDGDLWVSVDGSHDFECVTREGLDSRPLRQVADDFGPIRRAVWEAVYVASAATRTRLTVLESLGAGDAEAQPSCPYKHAHTAAWCGYAGCRTDGEGDWSMMGPAL